MAAVQLCWSEAEVSEGQLRVPLEPKPDKEWTRRFEGTAALLDRGAFGKVSLKKGQVRVGPIEPGCEEKLRHFLESVVLEANGPQEHEEADEPERQEEEAQAGDRDEGPDRQMTERFRAFGAGSGGEQAATAEPQG